MIHWDVRDPLGCGGIHWHNGGSSGTMGDSLGSGSTTRLGSHCSHPWLLREGCAWSHHRRQRLERADDQPVDVVNKLQHHLVAEFVCGRGIRAQADGSHLDRSHPDPIQIPSGPGYDTQDRLEWAEAGSSGRRIQTIAPHSTRTSSRSCVDLSCRMPTLTCVHSRVDNG